MNMQKRLRELEKTFSSTPICLQMPDGSTEMLLGYTGRGLLGLVCKARDEVLAGQGYSPDLDSILRSVSGTEPGGHMIEMARALLQAPAEVTA